MTCPLCRNVRFRTCAVCRQPQNSFRDFREYEMPRQVYETITDWREVNGTPEQNIPERKLQP